MNNREKKINVKCISTSVTVFSPGGGHYERSLSEYITIGNVYETTGVFGQQYFRIQHDHGRGSSEIPTYCFEATDEPVTINPNREREIQEQTNEARKQLKEQNLKREQQRISDNMERYYNPDGFRKIQAARARRRQIISDTFVGGLLYDDY